MLTKEQVEEIRAREGIGVPLDDIVIMGQHELVALCDSHDELQARLAHKDQIIAGVEAVRNSQLTIIKNLLDKRDELERELAELREVVTSICDACENFEPVHIRAKLRAALKGASK